MDINWKRIINQNIYDNLYISDSDSDSGNKPYLCNECKKKICRKSYKRTIGNINNNDIENNIKIIENNIKFLNLENKTNDNSLNPMKKPRNIGCGIYD